MISLVTNTDSINAQNNLNLEEQFQSNTIQQLTSGYRINSSADDAAGLAVANGLRDNIAQLNQGVQNATDGVAQLQIIDGGLSNISTMLDRMQTLATESASGTFTGNRSTLNQEYTGLISEITRQASNINLNAGGSMNQNLSVYIGGANNAANATVNVDLSGVQNAVDATSLGLSGTNVLGGGVEMTGNSVDLSNTATSFLAGSKTQTFTFNVMANGTAQSVTATLSGGANGISGSTAVSDLNADLSNYGITASIGSDGGLQFSGATAFTASVGAASGGNAVATSGSTAVNTSNYDFEGGTFTSPSSAETLTFSSGNGTTTYTVNAGDSLATTISGLNTAFANAGMDINAVQNAAGTGISLQSGSNFSVADSAGSSATTFSTALNSNGTYTVNAPSSSSTSNADAAINAITQAIQKLGLVQGSVGAGENKLNYAMNLANSQITNYSTAESGIRDANVAQEAADLTQAQVQQQASIAAMAQANSEPQAVLKLLQG